MLHKVSYRHARQFSFPAGMLFEGHLHLRMEELLQSVDILGLKVMISMALRQCF